MHTRGCRCDTTLKCAQVPPPRSPTIEVITAMPHVVAFMRDDDIKVVPERRELLGWPGADLDLQRFGAKRI